MTTDPADSDKEARQLLANSQELMERVRQKQRATWFPLFVLSAATFLAIPVLRFSHHTLTSCEPVARGGFACHMYSTWGVWYWPFALILAYFGISAFYIRRAHAQGLETRIRNFVIAGIHVVVIVTAMGYWTVHMPIGEVNILGLHTQERSLSLLHLIATPAFAIGVSLLVLAWIEHNRQLLYVVIVYLAIVLIPINFGWNLNHSRDWNFLPRLVIQGIVLLVAGIGFAITQRPLRRPAQ